MKVRQKIQLQAAALILLSQFLTGCDIAWVHYTYVPDVPSDPPLTTIQPFPATASISPTVLILSPTTPPTLTLTVTASQTPSQTATWTITPSGTVPTLTPSLTGTNTLTRTITSTRTKTPIPSLTWTHGLPTGSWTAAPSLTALLTGTPTASRTTAPTATASLTGAPTASLTASWTPTTTVTMATLTPSLPPPPIPTGAPPETATFTQTWTPQPSGSASPATPTPNPTATPGSTRSATATTAPTRTPSPTVAGCSLVYNSAYEAQVLALINTQRANANLPALSANSALGTSARAHSVDQASHNFMSHTGSDGSSPKDRITRAGYTGNWWGEIIYAGSGSWGTPSQAVTWWMNDPPHAAIILGTHYTDFGAGYAFCSTSDYGGYFTVDFGGP